MITLAEDDVRQRLDPAQVITRQLNPPSATVLPPPSFHNRTYLPTTQGVFLIMLCHDRAANAMGMKLVVVQDKPARPKTASKPHTCSSIPIPARPQLAASANYLTDVRTAATSAVADQIPRPRTRSRSWVVFGNWAAKHARTYRCCL